MDHDIVRITLERDVRIRLRHPRVERMMQEDVRKEGTDDPALRRAFGAGHARPVRSFGGRFQPALDVEQQPPAVRVLPDRTHHEAVIEIIEEAPDVQINDPVVSPGESRRTNVGR